MNDRLSLGLHITTQINDLLMKYYPVNSTAWVNKLEQSWHKNKAYLSMKINVATYSNLMHSIIHVFNAS